MFKHSKAFPSVSKSILLGANVVSLVQFSIVIQTFCFQVWFTLLSRNCYPLKTDKRKNLMEQAGMSYS